MKTLIQNLKLDEKALKNELIHTPMDADTRLKCVQALEQLGNTINLLENIEL